MDAAEALAHVLRANAARSAGKAANADERVLVATWRCDEHLAVYGTLAPGRENHHVLAPYAGTWTHGTVTGRRSHRAFPVFTFDPAAAPLPVHVLHSPALAEAWPTLDAFEGPDYRRILVPVHLADGRLRVANLYEAVAPVA